MQAVPQPCAGSLSQIGMELPSSSRVTVDTAVDAEVLARVLAVLQWHHLAVRRWSQNVENLNKSRIDRVIVHHGSSAFACKHMIWG